jgi:hypothetical protein
VLQLVILEIRNREFSAQWLFKSPFFQTSFFEEFKSYPGGIISSVYIKQLTSFHYLMRKRITKKKNRRLSPHTLFPANKNPRRQNFKTIQILLRPRYSQKNPISPHKYQSAQTIPVKIWARIPPAGPFRDGKARTTELRRKFIQDASAGSVSTRWSYL